MPRDIMPWLRLRLAQLFLHAIHYAIFTHYAPLLSTRYADVWWYYCAFDDPLYAAAPLFDYFHYYFMRICHIFSAISPWLLLFSLTHYYAMPYYHYYDITCLLPYAIAAYIIHYCHIDTPFITPLFHYYYSHYYWYARTLLHYSFHYFMIFITIILHAFHYYYCHYWYWWYCLCYCHCHYLCAYYYAHAICAILLFFITCHLLFYATLLLLLCHYDLPTLHYFDIFITFYAIIIFSHCYDSHDIAYLSIAITLFATPLLSLLIIHIIITIAAIIILPLAAYYYFIIGHFSPLRLLSLLIIFAISLLLSFHAIAIISLFCRHYTDIISLFHYYYYLFAWLAIIMPLAIDAYYYFSCHFHATLRHYYYH